MAQPSARSKRRDQQLISRAELDAKEKFTLRLAVSAATGVFHAVAAAGFWGTKNWARLSQTAKEKKKSPYEYARAVLLK